MKSNNKIHKNVLKNFKRMFKQEDPFLFKSPGKVNLVGGHTDYNDGFVLPITINRATYFAIKSNTL